MRLFIFFLFFTTLLFGMPQKKNQKTIQSIDRYDAMVSEVQQQRARGGDSFGYNQFLIDYLQKWHKKEFSYYYRSFRRNRIDPMDLFTGGAAIRETLQLDTIASTRNSNSTREKYDVPLKKLISTTPQIKSHPFKAMLGNRAYQYSKISSFIPKDFFYVRIASFTKGLNLWDTLMKKLKPLYKRFQTSNIDYQIKQKTMLQLALKENKIFRSFYDSVVEEAAITGSDPFIVSGSDVSILFKVKMPKIFEHKIKSYRKAIQKEEKASHKTIKINKKSVSYLFTQNRKVHSYFMRLDEKHFLLSNSKEALKRILNTIESNQKSKELSLYHSDEFKYMRSIYPLDKNEEIFVYLSDPFIRMLVGPQKRIKEARRVQEQMKIIAFQNLSLLYYQLYNKWPSSFKQLIRKLAPKDKKMAKKHAKYFMKLAENLKLSKYGEVKSILHGNLGYFRPNIDHTRFQYVTKQEANNYKRFARNYNNYWKDYFDPIGIRISTKNEKIVIDTHILPLINSSIYRELQQLIGGESITLQNHRLPKEWFHASLKLGSKLKKQLNKIQKEIKREIEREPLFAPFLVGQNFDVESLLGNQISLSVLDGAPLVDFNTSGLISDMLTRRSRGLGILAFFLTSFAHPLRVQLEINDKDLALKKLSERLVSAFNYYQPDREAMLSFMKKRYKNQDYTIATIKFFDMLTMRFFFFITDKKVEVTTTEAYLKYVIDQPMIRVNNSIKQRERNIKLSFHPKAIKQEQSFFINMLLDQLLSNNTKTIRNLELLRRIFKKVPENRELFKRFGFILSAPFQQNYIVDKKHIYHPVLKGNFPKNLDMLTIKKELLDVYFQIKEASVAFEFTDTGIDTRITIH